MDLLKWYKNKVELNELDPPLETWDQIQDQLDIDNSWQVIEERLNAGARSALWLRVAAAASLLILTVAGAAWIYFSSVNEVTIPALAENDLRDTQPGDTVSGDLHAGREKAIAETEIIVKEQILSGEETIVKEQVLSGKAAILGEQASSGEEALIREQALAREEALMRQQDFAGNEALMRGEALTKMGGLGAGSVTVETLKDKFDNIIPAGSFYQAASEKTGKAFRKFFVGTTGQLANTWLVNQKTISGFKSASLVSTNATFGSNFGIYAGTNLMNNLDLQADFNILAQNNQDYNEYMNGHYVSNKLKLDYSQLALSLRYYLMSSRFMQGEHGMNFGAYMAYLHNAYQKVDGETLYLSDNYNKLDYGLMLGYEYVFPLFEQFGLGTGFRAYYGLNNIYSGDDNIPSYMNVTNNASVNITLSLKYLVR